MSEVNLCSSKKGKVLKNQLSELCKEYLSFSNCKYVMTLSTHLKCVGGLPV